MGNENRRIVDERRRLKIVIEYDGTDFCGWQSQPDVRTVQNEIEDSLSQIFDEKTVVIGAGRTDSGVHALGQTAHFSTNRTISPDSILKGANSLMNKDVRLVDIGEAPSTFHARFDAVSRTYSYKVSRQLHPLERRITWHVNHRWDDEPIEEAVSFLKGKHSFKSFCKARPDEVEYICNIQQAAWKYTGENAIFTITADRFMHKMVRGLVGGLIDVGRGFLSVAEFRKLLDEPERNGATFVAPAWGLTLVRVEYPSGRN